MSLIELNIKSEYRSLSDDIALDFYIPLLKESIKYKRAVGYFSSSSLYHISFGIASLANNGGKIYLVASPYLSEKDIESIRQGYEHRDKVIRESLLRELKEPSNELEEKRLNILAHLIATSVLDIKIAFTEETNCLGMYHEKMGIIEDSYQNKVAFSGSMNESAAGMSSNYEAIDVFCSWKSSDQERVDVKDQAFTSIWNDQDLNVRTKKFLDIEEEVIKKYIRKTFYNINIDEDFVKQRKTFYSKQKTVNLPEIPEWLDLYDYQLTALRKWEEHDHIGIFDMATGTGKTFTGLAAIEMISRKKNYNLTVLVVCPYQHLVEQWVEELKEFNIFPIIGYSASPQKDWKKKLEKAIFNQRIKTNNRNLLCLICTNATFSSKFVQNQISKINTNTLLLVDEAHNFGAESLSRLLEKNNYKYRLALSATLDRHNDPEGTEKLYNFFGKKCIEYTLERAIEEKKLCKYKYYPVIVHLTEFERIKYADLTYELLKCLIKDKFGKMRLSERGKFLALERSRLVAGANEKIEKLRTAIVPYKEKSHILVYCGATKYQDSNEDTTSIEAEEIRQIEVVTDLLGNKLNMNVSQFTSKESIVEREALKREFDNGENLQVLIAIKCLDEGVNIPNIRVAFILASTTNPKEYIQRRGRVLRLAKGKDFAEIYDFLTLPRNLKDVSYLTEEQLRREQGLVRKELLRAREFSKIAMNFIESESILDDIAEAYQIESMDCLSLEEFENYE